MPALAWHSFHEDRKVAKSRLVFFQQYPPETYTNRLGAVDCILWLFTCIKLSTRSRTVNILGSAFFPNFESLIAARTFSISLPVTAT